MGYAPSMGNLRRIAGYKGGASHPHIFSIWGDYMFVINDDLTIECTRGDAAVFSVSADVYGRTYRFCEGDVIRFSVFEKKNCSEVVLRKDVEVTEGLEGEVVEIELTSEDTRIGDVISKPTDYWYEVELNPDTKPQTIIGYDKNGAKVFKLYPESEV